METQTSTGGALAVSAPAAGSDPFAGIALPPGATREKLLGVHYAHLSTYDGGDLYVTQFGCACLEHLKLYNWREEEWFERHREPLKGTSTVYKVPSKIVNGRSVDFVVKWCRVAEHVPLDTLTFSAFAEAEFNSPFEEFALVMQMRERRSGPRIRTHKPLAIYVPPEQLKLWQTGRSESKMAQKMAKHRDVELDILRQYIMIYEWVDGVSADEALDAAIPDEALRRRELAGITERARMDMEANGFMVVDHKPAHVILRPGPGGTLIRSRQGRYAYALVDFELLMRTPAFEQEVEVLRRAEYLRHQRDRFEASAESPLPEHLKRASLLGVEYIWGRAGSTHGMVWVVGKDPELFDFFLPERWRHTPRVLLSETAESYRTVSKDHVRLVWKVSRVGESPSASEAEPDAALAASRGYNSPFEEFSIAMALSRRGFSVIYPRAIYMAGLESPRAQDYVTDFSRFESHAGLCTPEGAPVLRPGHNYITIWGLWQGRIGAPDGAELPPCTGVDLLSARREGLLSSAEQERLFIRKHARLRAVGFDALLKPTHLLLSRNADGTLRRDTHGDPVVTICNFSLIRVLG